jgi:tetratricopeptide (TPR) repeat protein
MFLREESFGIDYFNIGMGLFELGRYQESIDAYLKSRAAFKASDEVASAVDCDVRLAENYAELKEPINVIHYGQRALDFFTVLDDYRKIWTLKYFLGCAHHLLGDNETAGRLLDEARNLAQAMGWKEWEFLIKVDEELAKIYEANLMHAQAAEMRRRVASIKELAAKGVTDEAA